MEKPVYEPSCKSTHPGSEFDVETCEFLAAIEQYRRLKGRRFPTWSEAIEILRSLGWRKVEQVEALGGQ